MTPGMPPLIVLTRKNGSCPSNDVMDCVVGNPVMLRLGNLCAYGGICFIDCMKDNQGTTFYQADPMLDGQGGRLRPQNSGRGGAPSLPHFSTIVLFVSERYFTLSGLPDLRNQTSKSIIGVQTLILEKGGTRK